MNLDLAVGDALSTGLVLKPQPDEVGALASPSAPRNIPGRMKDQCQYYHCESDHG